MIDKLDKISTKFPSEDYLAFKNGKYDFNAIYKKLIDAEETMGSVFL